MKANEIVERFKNVLLSNEAEVEATEVKEEATPEVEEQVELSEDVKNIEVEASEELESSEEVEAGYDDKMEEEGDMDKYATKEDLAKAIAEVKAMVEELSSQKEEELEVPTELSSQEPAVEPIAHNPEAEVSKKPLNLYAQKRAMTTKDIVFNKLFNS
jgi:phage terminase small subunit